MMLLHHALREKNSGGELVHPVLEQSYQPASIDLRLADVLLMYGDGEGGPARFDIRQELKDRPQPESLTISEENPYTLRPGGWVIASTLEGVIVPYDMVGRIEGKSGWARVGLSIHNAGFIDPGWGMHHSDDGLEYASPWPLTLELKNLGNLEIILYPGMWIAQISYMMGVGGNWSTGYGSYQFRNHYDGSLGVTASLIGQDMSIQHRTIDIYGRPRRKPENQDARPLIPENMQQEIIDSVLNRSPVYESYRNRGVKPDTLSWSEVPIPTEEINYPQARVMSADDLFGRSKQPHSWPIDEPAPELDEPSPDQRDES